MLVTDTVKRLAANVRIRSTRPDRIPASPLIGSVAIEATAVSVTIAPAAAITMKADLLSQFLFCISVILTLGPMKSRGQSVNRYEEKVEESVGG